MLIEIGVISQLYPTSGASVVLDVDGLVGYDPGLRPAITSRTLKDKALDFHNASLSWPAL